MVSWNRLEETVTRCDCGGLKLRGGPSWTRDQLPVLREQCVGSFKKRQRSQASSSGAQTPEGKRWQRGWKGKVGPDITPWHTR